MTDGNEPKAGDERPEKGKVVSFGGRGRRRDDDERSAEVIPIAAPRNGEPLPVTFNEAPLRIIALATVLVMLYFGRLVIIPVLVAILFAFMLAPLPNVLERKRVPRALGSGIAVILLGALLYVGSYFFYLRAVEFMGELPKYSRQIRDATLKYRKQAAVIQQTKEVIAPSSPDERRAMPVKSVEANDPATQGVEWMDAFIAASFIPFMAYFMLSWQGHVHRATVQLFAPEHRTNAYVTISNMGRMMRAFLIGNLVVGMILGAVSSAIFWWLGVPYFYFVGFISGFVSLVPYLGVVLALAPPLMVGIATVPMEKLTLVAAAVVVLHLVGVNVLYPKVLGRHLQLNPLAVTVGLLLFWFLWGGMGLVLAVPVTAAIKIICDHVPELNEWGFWLSEGEAERGG